MDSQRRATSNIADSSLDYEIEQLCLQFLAQNPPDTGSYEPDKIEQYCVEILTQPVQPTVRPVIPTNPDKVITIPDISSFTSIPSKHEEPVKPDPIKPTVKFTWVNEVPEEDDLHKSNLVYGGNDNSMIHIVCGAQDGSNFVPGHYIPRAKGGWADYGCFVPFGGRSSLLKSGFQLLKGTNYKWVKGDKETGFPNAFIAGQEHGKPVSPCLYRYLNDYRIVGKFYPEEGICHIPIDPCTREHFSEEGNACWTQTDRWKNFLYLKQE